MHGKSKSTFLPQAPGSSARTGTPEEIAACTTRPEQGPYVARFFSLPSCPNCTLEHHRLIITMPSLSPQHAIASSCQPLAKLYLAHPTAPQGRQQRVPTSLQASFSQGQPDDLPLAPRREHTSSLLQTTSRTSFTLPHARYRPAPYPVRCASSTAPYTPAQAPRARQKLHPACSRSCTGTHQPCQQPPSLPHPTLIGSSAGAPHSYRPALHSPRHATGSLLASVTFGQSPQQLSAVPSQLLHAKITPISGHVTIHLWLYKKDKKDTKRGWTFLATECSKGEEENW